jgi:hypothetical protein
MFAPIVASMLSHSMNRASRRIAYHEHVGDHAPPDQALAEGSERPLELYPVEEDTPRLGHAASRSAADK